MDIMKSIHCIIGLVKCSKCLYFIKKALCAVTILVATSTALCLYAQKNTKLKKAIKHIKAVI